jgi:site-specific recombinase XerD
MADDGSLVVAESGGGWQLGGPGAAGFRLVNDYLGYLADRNYSPRTVRAYAFDLLHFCRWLAGEGLGLDGVTTDVLLRFLASCREMLTASRPGGNVYSLLDGRNTGYAPATVNRRLAAVSGLFTFRQMRDPAAVMPVPRGRDARRAAGSSRTGLLGDLNRPKTGSGLRVRQPRRLPRGLDSAEVAALVGSLRTWRDRAIAGLMLYPGLRSAEVLGLNVRDVDIGGRWVRVNAWLGEVEGLRTSRDAAARKLAQLDRAIASRPQLGTSAYLGIPTSKRPR